MADTRCANPVYQLDVDVMILDYLIYNAIRSQIDAFKSASKDSHGSAEGGSSPSDNAAHLLQIFDAFVQLFKINHPEHAFSESVAFNLKLLEFVVLFTNRQPSNPSMSMLAPKCLQRLRTTTATNIRNRDGWLELRASEYSNTEFEVTKTLRVLWSSWNLGGLKQATNGLAAAAEISHLVSLAAVLPRFLELSAETADVMGEVNEKWMQLAAEFMLQVAMESLELDNDRRNLPTDDNGLESILQSFAWGYTNGPTVEQELLTRSQDGGSEELEILVSNMFQDPETGMELGSWTETRLEHMRCFVFRLGQENPEAHLRELNMQFPMREFELKIMAFIESLWNLVSDANWHGKPVLVQIEEGHLDGLNNADFAAFKERVGLGEHEEVLQGIKLEARQAQQKPQASTNGNSKHVT